MKILFVGAGASGVVGAISYKRNHLKDDVLIIEHLDKPLKKILATGNGKCNLGNENFDLSLYSNQYFVKQIISKNSLKEQIDFFDSISVVTKSVDGLIYPLTETAVTVRDALLEECKKLGIKINCEENLIDYKVYKKNIEVLSNKNKYIVDKLFISCGGSSSPNLGSDGSIFSILKNHKYSIKKCEPGLCPIETKENTKELNGLRVKACVSLFKNGKKIHTESGEVLFKNHGLSGIVIFNISRLIARDIDSPYKISLDLLEDYSYESLKKYCKTHGFEGLLRGYLHPMLKQYLIKKGLFGDNLIKTLKDFEFTFKKLYDFEFSQVTVGGLKTTEVNDSLESEKEPGVYFIGETLDVDAPCGGYNLMWAFASGLKIGK